MAASVRVHKAELQTGTFLQGYAKVNVHDARLEVIEVTPPPRASVRVHKLQLEAKAVIGPVIWQDTTGAGGWVGYELWSDTAGNGVWSRYDI